MHLNKLADKVKLSRSTIVQLLIEKPKNNEDYNRILEAMKEMEVDISESDTNKYIHRTKTIGVISRDLTEAFYNEFLTEIQRAADRINYGVVFVRQHIYSQQNVDYVKLLDEKVDGFIFLGEETSKNNEVETLLSQGVPCIIIQGKKTIHEATYLNVNNKKAAFHAMEHLVKQKHRRIIHITGPMNLYEVAERKRGYEEAVSFYGLEYQQTINTEMDYEEIFVLGSRIGNLIASDRITAAFCYNNMIATAIIDGLAEQSIYVPDNFSIIGFDDMSFRHLSQNWIPSLSSVKQPQVEMAQYAVEKVTEMMEGTIYDGSKNFECSFIDRDSTRIL